jgi:tripartite-type tricarboxylate transporter receptor subunit TctC
MKIKHSLKFLCAAIFAACLVHDANAARTIKIVVPYTPGGTCDNVGRILAKGLSNELHEAVIVDNRAGASTILGTQIVSNSPADGTTLLLNATPLAINQSLFKTLPYDTTKDLKPITVVVRAPMVLITRPSLNVKTSQDLIKLAKAEPGKLSFSAPGVGGVGNLAMQKLQQTTGTKMTLIPYKGSAEAVQAVLSGQVDMVVDTLFFTKPYVDSGKASAIALLSEKRSAQAKNIPTMDESGIKGVDVSSWYMLAAPSKTPDAEIERLNGAVRKVISDPSVRNQLTSQGLEVVGNSPAEAASFLKEQVDSFGAVVKAANIQPE